VNHTPKKPTSPPSSSGKRPWPARLFALGAVLLLVVSGLVVVISGLMSGSKSVDPAQEQSSYTADALARINELGSLDNAFRGRELPAPSDIGADEVAALEQELADAMARLHTVLAQANDLPGVPEGFVPGTDVGVELPPVQAGSYPLPKFTDGITLGGYDPLSVVGDASPVDPRTGLHMPKTGQPAVDDALGQLVGACYALRDLVGQSGPALPVPAQVPDPCSLQGVNGLPVDPNNVLGGGLPGGDPTGGLMGLVPLGDPTGLLGGVPTGDPSQEVQGANDALDPDELGAIVAKDHAGKILGLTGTAYTQTNRTLHDLLASYSTLALQLQDLVARAEAEAEKAEEALPVLLTERLTMIMSEAAQLRSDAIRMAAEYTRTAESEAERALGIVKDASKSHMADLQSTLDENVKGLNTRATQVMSLASTRKTEVTALVDKAVADLSRMSAESGVDAKAQIAAIQAAGDAALKTLDADAKAQVESLKATAAQLQARAQAAVPRMAAMASRAEAAINETLADAKAEAEKAKAYLVAFATARATLLEQAEERAQTAALRMLEDSLESYKAELKAKALALTNDVPDVVGSTSALVTDATALAQTEVGKDIAYIEKVAEDYSKVPTAERKARAEFWGYVSDAGEQALVVLDSSGDRLNTLAEQVQQAAETAKDQVEMVAATL